MVLPDIETLTTAGLSLLTKEIEVALANTPLKSSEPESGAAKFPDSVCVVFAGAFATVGAGVTTGAGCTVSARVTTVLSVPFVTFIEIVRFAMLWLLFTSAYVALRKIARYSATVAVPLSVSNPVEGFQLHEILDVLAQFKTSSPGV
jgi:hypothetical protein